MRKVSYTVVAKTKSTHLLCIHSLQDACGTNAKS